MATNRTPGLKELEIFVQSMEDVGITVENPRDMYKLGGSLLLKAYAIYQEQFARAPRKDKGKPKEAAKK